MAVLLTQRPVISEGDTDLVAIDFTGYLDADELLDGTPTVASLGSLTFDVDGSPVYDDDNTDLAFDDEAVSVAVLTILNKQVALGKAVQFEVSGQQEGLMYGVRITVSTDSTPPRTKVVDAILTTSE